MVKLDRIYTKGGDAGETSLGDGSRRAKDDIRVAAFGEVDELNAALGLAVRGAPEGWAAKLQGLQNDLFDLGADLCVPEAPESTRSRLRVTEAQVEALEQWIDAANADLPPLTSFILPGGTELAARLHLTRTICRRAERALVSLMRVEQVNPACLRYLNRLSDLLFVLARSANLGSGDILWTPGGGRAKG